LYNVKIVNEKTVLEVTNSYELLETFLKTTGKPVTNVFKYIWAPLLKPF
jgi:hypothetical protein